MIRRQLAHMAAVVLTDTELINAQEVGSEPVYWLEFFGGATDLLIDAAIAGTGIMPLFEDWLRPHFRSGALRAGPRTMVAAFRRTVSLLPWTTARACATASLCQFHQNAKRFIGYPIAPGAGARLLRSGGRRGRPVLPGIGMSASGIYTLRRRFAHFSGVRKQSGY